MLQKIQYPNTLEYSTDGNHLPIEFFMLTIPQCKRIDLKLGYFSSNAIRTLAYGFAQFIHNAGRIRIITNHFLSYEDRRLLLDEDSNNYLFEPKIKTAVEQDIESLAEILKNGDQHFFNCLKYLIKNHRLEIIPVKLKPDKLAHFKQGILDDGENQVYFNGSCNFTYKGLLDNGESLSIARSWGDPTEKIKVEENIKSIDRICNKEDEGFTYLKPEQIIEVIHRTGQDKQLDELLDEELDVYEKLAKHPKTQKTFSDYVEIYNLKVKDERRKLKFPYPEGPREYQQNACKKWEANGCKGIFAMATGTGKTITALNCLLNTYKQTGYYFALILVPTNDLQKQWIKEVGKFNIQDPIVVGLDSDWKNRLSRLTTNFDYGREKSFVIISTYVSFTKHALQNFIKYLPKETILIADEAHNIASPKVLEILHKTFFEKRIGLSATPKRIYDGEGTQAMNDFFADQPPYVYSFTMEEAIAKGILCQYDYYPHLVELTPDELKEYKAITKKLSQFFDAETNRYKDSDIANQLLMKRKRIIHKAENKLAKFQSIIKEEFKKRRSLKYTFVYVPEGIDNNSVDDEKIIQQYNQSIMGTSSSIRVSSFTGESDDRSFVLEAFEKGQIDVLTAMKCLDEGVDIPRTELAIFCSSTGNPRQFIQRRGRILRQHIDKKYAVIHDLVVIPQINFNGEQSDTFKMERSQVENELRRVADFAFMARNQYEAIERVTAICEYYGLSLFEIKESIK
ncbi:MAG: DEAD/DEAH box helicase family protein [Bacteroidales bacterium]|nr:DEAD/DEAH box helicase family protein [Bacteroidales bacterium]